MGIKGDPCLDAMIEFVGSVNVAQSKCSPL